MTRALAVTRAHSIPLPAAVLALGVAYVAWWAGGLSLTHLAPPLDSAEQLVWSWSLQGGYWKHPPLPSWILHALVAVFGPSLALPFFASFACAAVALMSLWRLGCEFMSPQRSLLAMALTALVGYHSFGADAYNHSSVLLPFQAAATLFFYLAVRRGDWHLWGLAGLFGGLAMLVKYLAVFSCAPLLLYFVLDRSVQRRRNILGLLLAIGVAALVGLPHLLWLRDNAFLPFDYVRSVTQPLPDFASSLDNLAEFLLAQVLRCSPLLLVLGWLVWRGRRAAPTGANGPAPSERLFLWMAGAGPLVLLVLYSLVTRTPLLARWGSTTFLLAGWLALDAVRRWPLPAGPAVWRPVLAAQVALWTSAVVVAPRVSEALDLRGRTNFPGAELAARAQTTWQARTGTPLRVVVSDVWLAGNMIAHGHPLAVLIDGEPQRAPWVTQQNIERCGALVLQDRTVPSENVPPAMAQWIGRAAERGTWSIAWHPGRPDPTPLRIEWAVLPPASGAGCPL